MTVSKDKVVSIEYKLTDDGGSIIDSSEGRGALSYIHGHGNLVTGLENELEGKEDGTNFEAHIQPSEGYGDYNDELLFSVPKERFSEFGELKEGMQFEAQTDQGHQIMAIKSVEEESVVVDANHPLAGQVLHFEGQIVGVREATNDELSHGHVHEGENHH